MCKQCDTTFPSINKHYDLCLKCNNSRLEELKPKKVYNIPKKKNKPLGGFKKKNKVKQDNSYFVKQTIGRKTKEEKIQEDENFYKKCFDSCSVHKCEECSVPLPKHFYDDDGNVTARYRYSHIYPKSTHPKLRHNILNINHLCLKCHTEWENGNKESMNIYITNKEREAELLKLNK